MQHFNYQTVFDSIIYPLVYDKSVYYYLSIEEPFDHFVIDEGGILLNLAQYIGLWTVRALLNTTLRRICGVMILSFLMVGCATWAGHGVTSYPHEKLGIAVLPVQSDVEISRLKDIETVQEPAQDVPDEKERIRQQMQKVTEDMTRSIETRLNASPYFEVVPHEQVAKVLAAQGAQSANAPLTPEQTKSLGTALNVRAMLVVRLSGYGYLKREWVVYLIGTGVVEGVVWGVIAGGATKNVWVGVAVALEEIGQEILTWGGGAFLFNMYYAPVTVEGELISTMDGKQVWSHTTFVSIDRKALKKLPEEEQKKKEVQLKVTAEKAEQDLVENLEKAARKSLWKESLDDAH